MSTGRQASVVRFLLVAALFTSAGCTSDDGGGATAFVASNRSQMVGGTRSLGDLGDIVMQNEKIRVVVQREGFSRGFGVYGGSLIDADLRRPNEEGDSRTARGNDQFAELFPAFFVQAVNVDKVKIINDGSDGGAAIVEASGFAGDFLELVALLNRAITGSSQGFDSRVCPIGDPQCCPRNEPDCCQPSDRPCRTENPAQIRYSTMYEVAPGAQYVKITFQVKNVTDQRVLSDGALSPGRTLGFPGRDASRLASIIGIDLADFTVPLGDIALFGATSKVFIPGVGFDLRFGLERAYARNIEFPAFPGFATEFVASQGENISYGLIVEPSDNNYALSKGDTYEDGVVEITDSSIVVPFVASSFVGLFYQNSPEELGAGESFEVVKYFVIGNGDVGSVLDEINEIRRNDVGLLAGRVFDSVTGSPAEGKNVVVFQRKGETRRPYSQYDIRDQGWFTGTLEPGSYSLKVVVDGIASSDFTDFEIVSGQTTTLNLTAPSPGRIAVLTVDSRGARIPSKATAVSTYDPQFAGLNTRTFLFDLEAGEEFRSTDIIPDDPNDPSTLEYIEAVGFGDSDGIAQLSVRPGTYEVFSSRGPEYDVASSFVTVRAGKTETIEHRLTQVVDTSGWVSLDSHVHSVGSIDSGMNLDDRVAALAAEGIELPVSTDHNFVTDYLPAVLRNDLATWMRPIVGLEMTTLESGHFNGFPLEPVPGAITRGSFEWADRRPDQIFEDIRDLGSLAREDTLVQVNHPRDNILGYYGQYSRDALSAEQKPFDFLDQFTSPTGPAFQQPGPTPGTTVTTFSDDYDIIEILNGKLYWEIHHYRVPEELPSGELPPEIPPVGSILRDSDGDVAFPGAVDDWFNLLNLGHRYIGVGTGDSHSGFDEPGQFRTMVYVGNDLPQSVSDQHLVDALRSRRVVSTNGPLVDFWIENPQDGVMGQTVQASGATVTLHYTLTSAPWISVGRLNIYRNGVIAMSTTTDLETDLSLESIDLSLNPVENEIELELSVDESGEAIDSWFIIEAIGYETMHPVIRTFELPPVILTDALSSLAGPLGFGADEFGALRPPETFPVTGYAITNPVWVTTHGGEFVPPGIVPDEVRDRLENDPRFQEGIFDSSQMAMQRNVVLQSRQGRVRVGGRRNVPIFYPRAGNFADVRKIMARLGALGRHGAPH